MSNLAHVCDCPIHSHGEFSTCAQITVEKFFSPKIQENHSTTNFEERQREANPTADQTKWAVVISYSIALFASAEQFAFYLFLLAFISK